jgi:hypothetical protein
MDIRTEVAAWRERSKIAFDRSDDAPAAVQKFELPPPALFPREPRSPEQIEANQKSNGVWINPESFKLLITGQEMMDMTRGEVRALVAARKAGTEPPPELKLSPEGERFNAAAIEVRDRIREMLAAQGHDPGSDFTLGMFDGKPRMTANKNRMWIDAPTEEIGQMIVNLWKTRGAAAPRGT